MAYILVKSNGIDTITVYDGNIDNYDTSLYYVGRYSKNYGLSIAQNTLRLMENFASPLSPENNPTLGFAEPVQGQIWYDSSVHVLKYYKNNYWEEIVDFVSDKDTTYSAGTGLNLNGTTFSVKYGTTAGTAAQGNDSRINNGQIAYGWGNHANAGYATTGDIPPPVDPVYYSGGTGINVSGTVISADLTYLDSRYEPSGGGGGTPITYTGGDGINVSGTVISVDSTNIRTSGDQSISGTLTATRFNTPSSIRFKNILENRSAMQSFNDVLAIARGGVKIGHYKNDTSKLMTRWLIAEEVAKTNPESINYDEDGKISSIDYMQLIPDLYASILHLNELVDELRGNK